MKVFAVLILTSLLTLQGRSQRLKSDSTCLPNTQLRLALKLIAKGKIAATELLVQKEQNDLLQSRIRLKDSIIYLQQNRDTVYQRMIDGYQKENQIFQEHTEVQSAMIVKLQKGIKKQKHKTLLAHLVNLLTALGLVYSLLK